MTTVNREGRTNVFTVGWTGVACSRPPMVTIAVRKERLSYENIRATGEFVINLTTREDGQNDRFLRLPFRAQDRQD